MAAGAALGRTKNPELGRYFTVPKGLIENGIAARIGASAVTIYVALCLHANQKNGNVVPVSDRTLAAETGVAERTIRQVRFRLCKERLVTVDRKPGASYDYTLIPVQLTARIPIKERLRKPRKPRAIHASRQTASALAKKPEIQQKLPHYSGESCHTTGALFADLFG